MEVKKNELKTKTNEDMILLFEKNKKDRIFSSDDNSEMLLEYASSLGYSFNLYENLWIKDKQTESLPRLVRSLPSLEIKSDSVIGMYAKRSFSNKKELLPALKTVVEFYSPIKKENIDSFRFALFSNKMSEMLEPVNLNVLENVGDSFECDVASVRTTFVNPLSEPEI